MAKNNTPVTSATRFLQEKNISYNTHLYKYQDKTKVAKGAAEALGVDEYHVIKTVVLEDRDKKPLIVLMHGNKEISIKTLARTIGTKSLQLCPPTTVTKWTGYMVGGTSPFGTRTVIPIYIEKTIVEIPRVWINGGKRGFMLQVDTQDLSEILQPTVVEVAIDKL